MQLQIKQVLPNPLQEKNSSEIWNKDWDLTPSEQVFLRAASGKGKSTLIHILYGLRNDYVGSIFFNNKNIKNNSAEDWALLRQKELSIVFQDLRLFDELSIIDNIAIKNNLTPGRSMMQSKEQLGLLGLASKLDQKAGTLSYGEKQRVAIVRALAQPFSWLLLDEPFSHLDDKNIEKAAALIQHIVQENAAGLLMVDLEDHNWFDFSNKKTL